MKADINVFKLLIENGADINHEWQETIDGRTVTFTPLIKAIKSKVNVNVLSLLIQNGANLNSTWKSQDNHGTSGQSSLMLPDTESNIIGMRNLFVGERNHMNKGEHRYKPKPHTNMIMTTCLGYSPLLCAIDYKSDSDVLNFLIKYGVDINSMYIEKNNGTISATKIERETDRHMDRWTERQRNRERERQRERDETNKP